MCVMAHAAEGESAASSKIKLRPNREQFGRSNVGFKFLDGRPGLTDDRNPGIAVRNSGTMGKKVDVEAPARRPIRQRSGKACSVMIPARQLDVCDKRGLRGIVSSGRIVRSFTAAHMIALFAYKPQLNFMTRFARIFRQQAPLYK